jgi:hypothetical protein
MDRLTLYIGQRTTGISVCQDRVYPDMWRIERNGVVSDMVNISRAKDAAISWARPKGLGGEEVAHWRYRQMARAGSPVRRPGKGDII